MCKVPKLWFSQDFISSVNDIGLNAIYCRARNKLIFIYIRKRNMPYIANDRNEKIECIEYIYFMLNAMLETTLGIGCMLKVSHKRDLPVCYQQIHSFGKPYYHCSNVM